MSTEPDKLRAAEQGGQGDGHETQSQNETTPSTTAEERIAELEAQLKEEKNRYMYLYADFENFKKRTIKERADLLKYGWEAAARELLEVIDNLERALAHMPQGTSSTLIDGLHMVLNQFRATLEKQGIQAIPAEKSPFDPNLHEAVAHEPSEEHPPGTVVKEHSKGYTLHGRLLRPSRVVVSAGKS